MKNIAKITSTKGLQGELKVKLYYDLDIEEGDSLFVEQRDESYLPYIVEYINDTARDGLMKVLKFEDVNDIDAATPLTKKELWVEDDFYDESLGEESYYRLIGYQVYDESEQLGTINDIIEQAQIILVIGDPAEGVYVPYVEDWIQSVDDELQKITMILPEGLLSINDSKE